MCSSYSGANSEVSGYQNPGWQELRFKKSKFAKQVFLKETGDCTKGLFALQKYLLRLSLVKDSKDGHLLWIQITAIYINVLYE